MGWLSDAADWVEDTANDAAEWVGDQVDDASEWLEETLDDAAEWVEETAESAANWAEENIPLIGGGMGSVIGWIGKGISAGLGFVSRVLGSGFDLLTAIVKGIASIIGGVLAGLLHILSGDFSKGLLKIFNGIVGGLILPLGAYISLVQTVFGIEGVKRRLNEKEILILEVVYCQSVNLDRIRIITGRSGVFGFNDRPFTMGDVIYMKNTGASSWDEDLVHEVCHVWQYQNHSSSYASEALTTQVYFDITGSSAYHWWDPKVNDGDMVWNNWNREAQAKFIENLYLEGERTDDGTAVTAAPGIFYGSNGVNRIGSFNFAPPNGVQPAEARVRWLTTLAAGETEVNYNTEAEAARLILHEGCNRE